MARKVYNRIQESTSDSMIDVRADPVKPVPIKRTEEDKFEILHDPTGENVHWSDGLCVREPDEELTDIEMKYHIDSNVLGEGHHGSVRKCIERSTGKQYAVKTMCKTSPSVNIRAIEREVSLLACLKHKHILQMHDVFVDREHVHIVTELYTGGELFDKIIEKSSAGRGCFTEEKAVSVISQVLEAVAYMHLNNVAHRDIKPENILFETNEDDSDIVLIDFGLARRNKRDLLMSTVVGTPYYLAPEVLNKSYSRSCDMWSIGVITYILLCGYPPFNGANANEVYESIRRGVFYFPSTEWQHVSHIAKDFVVQLLQIEPKRRMTAKQALRHPWIVYHQNIITKMRKYKEHLVLENDEYENGDAFVEVVFDEAASSHKERIVCGGICTP